MKKTSNSETPFSLTYGTEAVIPAEIGMPTHKTSNVNEKTNDQELRLNLDLLDERREIAAIREARYKQQVEKYYNKKVWHVQFKVGEFELRRNEVSRAANTGKLGPTWEGPYKVIQAFQSGAYKLSNMEGEEIPRTWHACNLRRHDIYEIYGRLEGTQDDRSLMSGRLNMLFRDRRAHARTAKLMEAEARLSPCRDWSFTSRKLRPTGIACGDTKTGEYTADTSDSTAGSTGTCWRSSTARDTKGGR
ncbi:hypothetical protein Tco_1129939 [Tanacetum coccineum]